MLLHGIRKKNNLQRFVDIPDGSQLARRSSPEFDAMKKTNRAVENDNDWLQEDFRYSRIPYIKLKPTKKVEQQKKEEKNIG